MLFLMKSEKELRDVLTKVQYGCLSLISKYRFA